MKVFKFGGASVKDAPSMVNVGNIIRRHQHLQLVVVISALGKTTNALEEVAHAFFKNDIESAHKKIEALEKQHNEIAQELIKDNHHPVFSELKKLFIQLRQTLDFYHRDNFDFLYDQVVATGELFSTRIMAAHCQNTGIHAVWLDARTVIKTDTNYREPKINWEETHERIRDTVVPLLKDKIVITQGFIGSTSNNYTTTLGREGSDFTAAIFSNILEAEEQVIWKDVPGVLNANPSLFPDAVKIDKLPYEEAVEMTYYGAQVIHPKTIKPLQNKNIPLHVRSFIESEKDGTLIHNIPLPKDIPPIIVIKKNQVLLSFSTKDFSFMAEDNLGQIIEEFAKLRIKTNVMQNAAISMSVVIDLNEGKLNELVNFLEPHFNVSVEKNVEVLTIRHYNDAIVGELTNGKDIVITQKTKDTVQFVCKQPLPNHRYIPF
ncbi:MAG TPA: aspartate kinase [Chitinophagales bacterium]|nr:aspartate kinase [Chitinophagales bacterium]